MRYRPACILASLLCAVINLGAQQADSGFPGIPADKYLQAVSQKGDRLQIKLDRTNQRALRKFQRLERKMQQRVARIDSSKAKTIFVNSEERYNKLKQKLTEPASLQQYISQLDTLNTSIKFLQQYPQLLSKTTGAQQKLKAAFSNINGLETRFQQAEEIKNFLKERREYLRNQLSNLGFARELKTINKRIYSYGAQLNEYKSLLKDHRKAERKALELLSKSKQFQSFMRKNSMLASLFRLPGDPDEPVSQQASLAGLQTRSQVNGLIRQQVAAGGPNAQQQLQQNMQSAQAQIYSLKEKLNQLGSGSSDDVLPEGFRANPYKTKSFFRRLELGANIQSQKANGPLPARSDIGVSLGYKLNDYSVVGIGGNYGIGWGRDIRHIDISHQALGLRSFVDWKIKGSLWITGAYEMNYRSGFEHVEQLKDLDAWQQSGLIGLSKVVSLKTKFFKKTKLQLLWDFLSYQQIPKANAVVFSIGYTF